MGDHFDKNEKNPPGGATVAKYLKQTPLLNRPQGSQKNRKDLSITTMIHFTTSF